MEESTYRNVAERSGKKKNDEKSGKLNKKKIVGIADHDSVRKGPAEKRKQKPRKSPQRSKTTTNGQTSPTTLQKPPAVPKLGKRVREKMERIKPSIR